MNLNTFIRDVPDYPKEGIVFKDITPLLADHDALKETVLQLAARFRDSHVDMVVSVEARGFLFGPAVALALGAGFVPVRKPGKLPCQVSEATYELEYGVDTVQMHTDAIKPGQKVLLIDDLVATGGTIEATARLVEKLGGEVVGLGFLMELAFLKPRERLAGRRLESLIVVP
jgi:adenine phosphoribosyltransferase